jgi:hypothetical protein
MAPRISTSPHMHYALHGIKANGNDLNSDLAFTHGVCVVQQSVDAVARSCCRKLYKTRVREPIVRQGAGIGLRPVPVHFSDAGRQARKYAAALLASKARNDTMSRGGSHSSRVRSAEARSMALFPGWRATDALVEDSDTAFELPCDQVDAEGHGLLFCPKKARKHLPSGGRFISLW